MQGTHARARDGDTAGWGTGRTQLEVRCARRRQVVPPRLRQEGPLLPRLSAGLPLGLPCAVRGRDGGGSVHICHLPRALGNRRRPTLHPPPGSGPTSCRSAAADRRKSVLFCFFSKRSESAVS